MGLASFAPALRPLSRFQTNTPDVEIELTAAPGEVSIQPGAPTRVWKFTGRVLRGPATTLETIPGSYLGPVIRLRKGQRVRIRFHNRLPEPSIVHWHGLDVDDALIELAPAQGAEDCDESQLEELLALRG